MVMPIGALPQPQGVPELASVPLRSELAPALPAWRLEPIEVPELVPPLRSEQEWAVPACRLEPVEAPERDLPSTGPLVLAQAAPLCELELFSVQPLVECPLARLEL